MHTYIHIVYEHTIYIYTHISIMFCILCNFCILCKFCILGKKPVFAVFVVVLCSGYVLIPTAIGIAIDISYDQIIIINRYEKNE